MPTRAEILLAPVPGGGRIIEIGPSFNPIAPKSAGWNSVSIDHLTREDLVAKYTGHPGVDVSRIEPVDFVWTSGPLSAAVPPAQHGTFDAFVASHVIEHTPDLIAFLDSAATLLKPEGVVILVIPDKRYCFDYFQPLTTTGQLLEAHADRRSRHTSRLAFDHFAYAVADGDIGAWGQRPSQGIRFMHALEDANEMFAAFENSSAYADLHAWRFVPSSFELLLLELARLGKTDWRVERTTPADGCEFFAWLRRGGAARVKALAAEEMIVQRLTLLKRTLLETRAQIDWLLAGEPGLVTGPLGLLPTTAPTFPAPAPLPSARAENPASGKLDLQGAYTQWVDRSKSERDHVRAMTQAIGGEFEALGIVERELLYFFGLEQDAYLVDIGCGSGRLAIPLSRTHRGRYLGTDLVRDLTDFAAAACNRSDWRFETVSGLTIPERDGVADMVCFFSVFTHLLHEQTYLYLQEAKRVLQPGGRIVFSFLEFRNGAHWAVFSATVADMRGNQHHPLNVFFDRDAIRAWAAHLGLEVVDIRDGSERFVPLPEPVTLDSGERMEEYGNLGQSICVLQVPNLTQH
jgi:2-polyprenyl-3-methyl-5-hydroxy-6-metoxy-1,4-benzoquinol methylase